MDRFGSRLRDARLALDMSLATAARGIVSLDRLLLLESNQEIPSVEVAEKLLVRMHASPEHKLDPSLEQLQIATAIESALRHGDWRFVEHALLPLPDDTPRRRFYRAMALERQGDFLGALAELELVTGALDLLSTYRCRAVIAACRCARDSGDLARATAEGERALAVWMHESTIDEELLSELRATLAGAYCETGNLNRAFDLTRPPPEGTIRTAWSVVTQCWALAMTLQAAGRFEDALGVAHAALRALSFVDRPSNAARMQNAAAHIAMQTADFDADQTDQILAESEAQFRMLDAPIELALVLTTRAELAALRMDHARVWNILNEAIHLIDREAAGDRARITAAAAHTFASIGEVDRSMALLLTARELLESSGAKRSAAATWQEMAATYESLGQTDLQVACLRAAMDLLDL